MDTSQAAKAKNVFMLQNAASFVAALLRQAESLYHAARYFTPGFLEPSISRVESVVSLFSTASVSTAHGSEPRQDAAVAKEVG